MPTNGTAPALAPDLTLTGAPDAYWSERVLHAMGSVAHIISADTPAGVGEWAVAELERLEQCWSRFRADSELSRLNRGAGAWTDVSASMLLALSCVADLHRATEGRFDATIIDALERSGYDRTFESVAPESDAVVRTSTRVPGFAPVEIDEERSRARLPVGTRIDLGGVGKGLAADLVARGIVDRGARSALVGLGGDLRARGESLPGTGHGDGGQGGWDIPVADPFDERRVAFRFPLTDGALVTSTTRIRRWNRGGTEYHHIVDPATGDPARSGIAAVVAAARDAWWAEGIAKAIIVGGIDRGEQLAAAGRVHAWMFLDDGRVVETGSPS